MQVDTTCIFFKVFHDDFFASCNLHIAPGSAAFCALASHRGWALMACMNEALQLTNVRSPAPAEFALLQAGAEEEPGW